MDYRVSKEVLLDIAERCDRKTLLNLLQTNKDVHALISDHERSISAAKLKNFLIPPQSHLLTSKDEQRCVILKKNSFATVRELELREVRMCSILDHGGFLLTDKPASLGLTSASLDKLKAGLKRALYIADRLADAAADPDITRSRGEMAYRLALLRLNCNTGPVSDENIAALRDAEFEAHVQLTKAIRNKQLQILRDLSTMDLVFLLTVREAAMLGWQRYMAKYATADVQFYNKMNAFGELLCREGCFILWAFARGTGGTHAHVKMAVTVVAEQIWRYEVGLDQNDDGLSMALHKELRQRFIETRSTEDRTFNETQSDNPAAIRQWAHDLVGKEIGSKGWKGYYTNGLPLSQ